MKIKSIGAMVLLFSMSSGLSFAYQCGDDVNAMNVQILKDGSIVSPVDGHRFNFMVNPIQGGHSGCFGQGYYNGELVCDIQWEPREWGASLHCRWGVLKPA